MEAPRRRESDMSDSPYKENTKRGDIAHNRDVLQKCIEEHSMAPSKHIPTIRECLRNALDCEFKNPVPGLIRSFIRAVDSFTKGK